MRTALYLVLACLMSPAQAAQCQARSGPHTTALVELYTSEGCDSCPPADRWLQGLAGRGLAPDRVVPLSLHVNYWDYIGWKDPYARREFALRQKKLSALQRMAFVYTPQVVLQGRDFRGWADRGFDEAVARINAQPARARLRLAIVAADPAGLDVEAGASLVQPSADAALYIAAYRNRLESQVQAGENRGRILSHDYVVLEWQGPIALGPDRRMERRRLALVPGAGPADSGVAAFVQDRRTGEVLQALLRSAC